MIKRLTRQGNSVALVLDKKLLDEVQLEEGAEVEVSTNGDAIIVTPVRSDREQQRFRASFEKIDRRYAGAFKRLAK
jgi:antitoxin component of MazEF toxin-antitoxin module